MAHEINFFFIFPLYNLSGVKLRFDDIIIIINYVVKACFGEIGKIIQNKSLILSGGTPFLFISNLRDKALRFHQDLKSCAQYASSLI